MEQWKKIKTQAKESGLTEEELRDIIVQSSEGSDGKLKSNGIAYGNSKYDEIIITDRKIYDQVVKDKKEGKNYKRDY